MEVALQWARARGKAEATTSATAMEALMTKGKSELEGYLYLTTATVTAHGILSECHVSGMVSPEGSHDQGQTQGEVREAQNPCP